MIDFQQTKSVVRKEGHILLTHFLGVPSLMEKKILGLNFELTRVPHRLTHFASFDSYAIFCAMYCDDTKENSFQACKSSDSDSFRD